MEIEVGKYYEKEYYTGAVWKCIGTDSSNPLYPMIVELLNCEGVHIIDRCSKDGKIQHRNAVLTKESDRVIFNTEWYPIWAKYLAMNESGDWWYFAEEPEWDVEGGVWVSSIPFVKDGYVPEEYYPMNFKGEASTSLIKLQ